MDARVGDNVNAREQPKSPNKDMVWMNQLGGRMGMRTGIRHGVQQGPPFRVSVQAVELLPGSREQPPADGVDNGAQGTAVFQNPEMLLGSAAVGVQRRSADWSGGGRERDRPVSGEERRRTGMQYTDEIPRDHYEHVSWELEKREIRAHSRPKSIPSAKHKRLTRALFYPQY